MLKPFYNKKKNIDDRLVPEVSSADAGKVLGVTEEGKIAAVEAGGGGGSLYCHAINLYDTQMSYAVFNITLYTMSETAFTFKSFSKWLYDHGFRNNSTSLFRDGNTWLAPNVGGIVFCLGVFSSNGNYFTTRERTITLSGSSLISSDSDSRQDESLQFNDIVTAV